MNTNEIIEKLEELYSDYGSDIQNDQHAIIEKRIIELNKQLDSLRKPVVVKGTIWFIKFGNRKGIETYVSYNNVNDWLKEWYKLPVEASKSK